jgi:hypothetical protein
MDTEHASARNRSIEIAQGANLYFSPQSPAMFLQLLYALCVRHFLAMRQSFISGAGPWAARYIPRKDMRAWAKRHIFLNEETEAPRGSHSCSNYDAEERTASIDRPNLWPASLYILFSSGRSYRTQRIRRFDLALASLLRPTHRHLVSDIYLDARMDQRLRDLTSRKGYLLGSYTQSWRSNSARALSPRIPAQSGEPRATRDTLVEPDGRGKAYSAWGKETDENTAVHSAIFC